MMMPRKMDKINKTQKLRMKKASHTSKMKATIRMTKNMTPKTKPSKIIN